MSDKSHVDLAEATCILAFFQGAVGNRRRIAKDNVKTRAEAEEFGDGIVQTEVDKDALFVSKELFRAPELRSIVHHNHETRRWVRGIAMPSNYRAGMHLVKLEATKALDDGLTDRSMKKDDLVEAFVEVMPARKEEAKVFLGPAFDETDYPTAAQVRKAFRWEWKLLTMATPTQLRRISAALFEREAKKAVESLESMVKNIDALLAAEARAFVSRLVDRLTPAEDGKRKVFRNTLTTNISDFLAKYPLRSIGSSEKLDAVMRDMGKLLDGVDPEQLRDNDRLASDLRAGFEKAQATLQEIEAPERLIELPEDGQ